MPKFADFGKNGELTMECNYSELKKMFAKNDMNVIINEEEKQKTLKEIRAGLQGGAVSVPKSKWQILKIQIMYIDKIILLMHLIACIGIVLLGKWQQSERIFTISACVLGALSLLEVSAMFFTGVTELEESCYFNVRQIAVLRMTYSGIISLAAILTALVIAGREQGALFMETGLYTLVPFVFTECVCMTVMVSETGRRNKILFMAAGGFSVLFWGILSTIPSLYETSAAAFWWMAFLAGTGIFVIQTKRFFRALEKGEILCVD